MKWGEAGAGRAQVSAGAGVGGADSTASRSVGGQRAASCKRGVGGTVALFVCVNAPYVVVGINLGSISYLEWPFFLFWNSTMQVCLA